MGKLKQPLGIREHRQHRVAARRDRALELSGNNNDHPKNLVYAAQNRMFQWTVHTYPGPRRGITALFRNNAGWSAFQNWRHGTRPLPAWAAEILASWFRSRIEGDTALLHQLEAYIKLRQSQPKRSRGFLEVKERDGPGSVPRNASGRGARPKTST
jgi:hypothetical protein